MYLKFCAWFFPLAFATGIAAEPAAPPAAAPRPKPVREHSFRHYQTKDGHFGIVYSQDDSFQWIILDEQPGRNLIATDSTKGNQRILIIKEKKDAVKKELFQVSLPAEVRPLVVLLKEKEWIVFSTDAEFDIKRLNLLGEFAALKAECIKNGKRINEGR
jgi:hypothetical protein